MSGHKVDAITLAIAELWLGLNALQWVSVWSHFYRRWTPSPSLQGTLINRIWAIWNDTVFE